MNQRTRHASRVPRRHEDAKLTELPPFDDADLFDEAGYLRLYPGIAQAMMQGVIGTAWDHYFHHEASRADSAGIGGRHGEPALGVTDSHVITRVLGFGRVRVNERRKCEERNATAGD